MICVAGGRCGAGALPGAAGEFRALFVGRGGGGEGGGLLPEEKGGGLRLVGGAIWRTGEETRAGAEMPGERASEDRCKHRPC